VRKVLPIGHGDLHKRKKSGGRSRAYRGKRAFEAGSDAAETLVGEKKLVRDRARGGSLKMKALAYNFANVADPSTQKSQKVQIVKVVKNPSNIDYQRRGVITKGAIVETPLGQARVTSRPGHGGVVNAILLQKS